MARVNFPCLEKTFEYCQIQWSIKNAPFVVSSDEYMLRSKDFTVNHPQITKWRLALKSSWTVDNVNILSVLLERLESDTGPKTVWVNWRIAVLNEQHEEHGEVECESYFEESHARELDILSFPEVHGFLQDNTLLILCQMIVDHNHDEKKLCDFEDLHSSIKSLTDDLRRLCNRSTFYDIALKIDDKCFRAHRSIIAARNTFLCDFIGTDTLVDLEHMDPEAVDRVLRYFYTGNLFYIFVNPTIALFRCLVQFEMKELLTFFTKEKYDILTRMMAREYTLSWSIPDLLYTDENYLCSEFMKGRRSSEIWQLHLYPRGVEGNSSEMDLFIEYAKGSEPLDVCIEISVLDSSNSPVLQNSRFGYIQVSERFEFRQYIQRNLLPHILRRNVLHLVVTVQKSSGEHFSAVLNYKQDRCPAIIPISLYFMGLSINMEQLYHTGAYADVTLIAGERPFFAHKCVLAARSKMFLAILGVIQEKVVELDIEPDILQMLLKYIYSGNLPVQDLDTLRKLYETALTYGIPSLKHHSVLNLKGLLDQDTVVDILVFADDNKDENLKHTALDFIWRSQNRQSNQEESWENLVYDRPTLFRDIIDYIMMKDIEVSDNSNG